MTPNRREVAALAGIGVLAAPSVSARRAIGRRSAPGMAAPPRRDRARRMS